MAKNKVIAGDYEGKPIASVGGEAYIITGWFKTKFIKKEEVEEHKVIVEEQKNRQFYRQPDFGRRFLRRSGTSYGRHREK